METNQQTFISLKQVVALTTLSKTAIYSRITRNPLRPQDYDPTFPRPAKIGAKRVAWVLAEVQAWIASQIEKREVAA